MGVTPGHKVYGGHLELFLPHVTNSPMVPVTGNNKDVFLTDEQVHRGLAIALFCNGLALETDWWSSCPQLWYRQLLSSGNENELVDCTLVLHTSAQQAHTSLLMFHWPRQMTWPDYLQGAKEMQSWHLPGRKGHPEIFGGAELIRPTLLWITKYLVHFPSGTQNTLTLLPAKGEIQVLFICTSRLT